MCLNDSCWLYYLESEDLVFLIWSIWVKVSITYQQKKEKLGIRHKKPKCIFGLLRNN